MSNVLMVAGLDSRANWRDFWVLMSSTQKSFDVTADPCMYTSPFPFGRNRKRADAIAALLKTRIGGRLSALPSGRTARSGRVEATA